MNGEHRLVLPLAEAGDVSRVGGKAANLGRLLRAGFQVPDGFVVTTAGAFRKDSEALRREIEQAYEAMGAPPVAVRSSATVEDQAEASLAGQFETILDVRGLESLLSAVRRCWEAGSSDRVGAYLRRKGIDPASALMAIVVQRLVPAEVAGVLFTANPRTGSRDELLIEASWGLGESVVSGLVQPDTYVLDRHTGELKGSRISDKRLRVGDRDSGPQPVAPEDRTRPCLDAQGLAKLWDLGARVAAHYSLPQDLEWAIHEGKLHLLQARPITTLEGADELSRLITGTRERLAGAKAAGHGDWVRHNLSETLPHPTPLTWSVIRRFMSGAGGIGALYRSVGFEPSEQVVRDGFLDLVAGRITMDLSRAPEMFFEKFPFRYDPELLRTEPDAAQGPPTVPAGTLGERWRVGRRLSAIERDLYARARDYDVDLVLEAEVIPPYVRWVAGEKGCDLAALSNDEWVQRWVSRESRVLDEFGPKSLLPGLIASMAVGRLRALLADQLWDDDPGEVLNMILGGGEADRTVLMAQGLHEVARGTRSLEEWLTEYGHRAPGEFDLAEPRWWERPDEARIWARQLEGNRSPLDRREKEALQCDLRAGVLLGKLARSARREFQELLSLARRHLRAREEGKHALLLGYDLLRDLAREAGRRLGLGADVFLLSLEELQKALKTGNVSAPLIEERRKQRAVEGRIQPPFLITEESLKSWGGESRKQDSATLAAFAVSGGSASGPARVVLSATQAGDLGKGYVLVCPSTDPSWTPLFMNAVALVLERGGSLSHGAVVARELGLPAIILEGATEILTPGERVTVDGWSGALIREEISPVVASDPGTARLRPPPGPGSKERRSWGLLGMALAAWGLYFAGAFLLPERWLYEPSMNLLDALLWPLVRVIGKPGTVMGIAGGLAFLSMAGQRWLTDNARLRVARDRSPAFPAQASGVRGRMLAASMVPLAVLLGPMVMTFFWIPARLDPASANPRPGAEAHVVATVDGEHLGPFELVADPGLILAEETSAVQAAPPLRATLEKLHARWSEPAEARNVSWDLRAAAARSREGLLTDLADYLRHPMPLRDLRWTIVTPPGRAERYGVRLESGDSTPIQISIGVGDAHPPTPREFVGPPGHPVRQVRVSYSVRKTPEDEIFWMPAKGLFGWSWDPGWLGAYLAAYLPLMMIFRRLLRVA
jgi:pyruvate,water dikinase